MKLSVATTILAFLPSCFDLPQTGDDSVGDDDPVATDTLELAGHYSVQADWDLSSLLDNDALGDAASQFLIAQLVSTLGVPSVFEDDAIDLLDDKVGDIIANEVSSAAASSDTLATFRSNLGTVHVDSEWLLEGLDPHETLLAASFEAADAVYEIDLTVAQPVADIRGDLALTGTGASRIVSPYSIELAAGALIMPRAQLVMATLAGAIDCDKLAARVLEGKPALEISIAGFGYSITQADVAKLCENEVNDLSDSLLSSLSFDLAVDMAGSISLTDSNADDVADEFTSKAGYAARVLESPLSIAVSLRGKTSL